MMNPDTTTWLEGAGCLTLEVEVVLLNGWGI